MATCVSEQFTVNGGVLGHASAAFTQIVATAATTSVGDGAFNATVPIGGKEMVYQQVHWTNSFPNPVTLRVWLIRSRWEITATSSNVAKIRERWTYLTGVDDENGTVTAADPVPSSSYDGGWGIGDIAGTGTNGTNTPRNALFIERPGDTHRIANLALGPGQSVDIRYRASLFLPNGFFTPLVGTDTNTAYVFGSTIELEALPRPAAT